VSWSARQYVAYEEERTRPARDLLAAVPASGVSIAIDIGCGPGNSTELLAARYPAARITGIDTSADMIAAARARLPALCFELADIRAWAYASSHEGAERPDSPRGGSGTFDLVFANAVLQWVPGHAELFPALAAKLNAGGWLAVQVPDNLDEPAQTLMRTIAEDGPWNRKLAGADRSRVRIEPAAWYHRVLRDSCSWIEVWRTTYYHPLAGSEAIVEWFRGTGLQPFLAPLDAHERVEYLARYTRAIESAYPAPAAGTVADSTVADGTAAEPTVLLPFPRLFVVARRR
jgi:trans-aconitate 2-methyltransferase